MWRLTGKRPSEAQDNSVKELEEFAGKMEEIARDNTGALSQIPETVSFVDVETTGLTANDRIVSIGIICLKTLGLSRGKITADSMHLIFDPGKKSHPNAELVHGYDDWTLRHQDFFCDHAESIRSMLSKANLIVAHNAKFDMEFINRELDLANKATLSLQSVFCTMTAFREIGVHGGASLSAICKRIGLDRQGMLHSALEDAWLAMQLYLYLHQFSGFETSFSNVKNPQLLNYRTPPPRPEGRLPNRKRRKKSSLTMS